MLTGMFTDVITAIPRRIRPRRSRCGLSLFEAALVMLIAVPATQQGVRMAEGYIREQAGVQESRLLSQVVTAASALALRDLNERIKNIVGVGNVQVLTLDDLAAQNAWISTASRTALGRDVQVIFHARGSEELVVLARAWTPEGEENRPYVTRGGIGIGLVGTIPEHASTLLRGPGLNYDLTGLQAQAMTQFGSRLPVAGNQLAIAVLRMDQDVSPFLHRKAVEGRPDLNRMETDLDMGGFDLVGAGQLHAETITVRNFMEISELRGTLEVDGDIQAGGNLIIPGALTSADADIGGGVLATGLEVTGHAGFITLEAQAGLSARTVTAREAVTVDGEVTAETLAAEDVVATGVTAPAATIGTVQAGRVTSTSLDVSGELVAEEIVTGRCTGC